MLLCYDFEMLRWLMAVQIVIDHAPPLSIFCIIPVFGVGYCYPQLNDGHLNAKMKQEQFDLFELTV